MPRLSSYFSHGRTFFIAHAHPAESTSGLTHWNNTRTRIIRAQNNSGDKSACLRPLIFSPVLSDNTKSRHNFGINRGRGRPRGWAENTLVPLKATGVSFLVSDDRIPPCYTTSFSSTATMVVVHVVSRRLFRIEVCSLYTETHAYAQLTCALLYTPLHETHGKYGRRLMDRNSRDLSRSWASQRSTMGCTASPSLFQTGGSSQREKFNGETCNL